MWTLSTVYILHIIMAIIKKSLSTKTSDLLLDNTIYYWLLNASQAACQGSGFSVFCSGLLVCFFVVFSRFSLCGSVFPSLVIVSQPLNLSLVTWLVVWVCLSPCPMCLPLVVPCYLPTCVLFSPVYLSPSPCSVQRSVIVFVRLLPASRVALYSVSFD